MANKSDLGVEMNPSSRAWPKRLLESIPASYTVWHDVADSLYRGECNLAEGDDFVDASPLNVVNDCMGALATNGGNIVVKGPISISDLDALTHDIHLFGMGEVEIATSGGGAAAFTLAESASVSNVYLKNNGNVIYYWNWTTAHAQSVYFTNFPSLGGVATGTPEMLWDGTLNLEGASYIANSLALWLYNAGGAQSYCMLTAPDATKIAVRNVADTEYRDLKIRNLYVDGGYVLPTGNLFINTSESVTDYIALRSWTGAAHDLTVKIMNGLATFSYGFNFVDNGYISTPEATKHIYFRGWTGAAHATVADLVSAATPYLQINNGVYYSQDGTIGATADVAVAKVGGGTRTLSFKNGLYTGYADS